MLRSSPRKADVQPGLRVWAYDLPRPADASSGAPKRWLAADAATFASMYIELRPEDGGTPTRCSRLRACRPSSVPETCAPRTSAFLPPALRAPLEGPHNDRRRVWRVAAGSSLPPKTLTRTSLRECTPSALLCARVVTRDAWAGKRTLRLVRPAPVMWTHCHRVQRDTFYTVFD